MTFPTPGSGVRDGLGMIQRALHLSWTLFLIILSAPLQIIRHRSQRLGMSALGQSGCRTNPNRKFGLGMN